MSQLSKKELAAIDLMIAQLEEGGSHELEGFIGSIVNAISDVAHAVTDVATAACPAVQVVAQVCPAVAAAGVLAKGVSYNTGSLLEEVNKSGLKEELTLENLKKIRKQYS